MAVFAVSIEKGVGWRGAQQPFSNVYHYVTETAEPFNDGAVIADLVAAEKLVHSTDVEFLTARTWGPTEQGPLVSKTREIADLDGTGAVSPSPSWYRELALLISWDLGRYGLRNRRQFARKWLHTCTGTGLPSTAFNGSTAISAVPQNIVDYIGSVRFVGGVNSDAYTLCTAEGRTTQAPGQLYPYIEHRQLGR